MQFKGERLRKLLEEKGMSITDLAIKTNKTKQYWSGVVNGHRSNLRPSTVKELCALFNVDEEYFYLDDARLISEVVPGLPDEVKSFLADKKNTPYLVLSEKAKRAGLSPETIQKVIDLLLTEKR